MSYLDPDVVAVREALIWRSDIQANDALAAIDRLSARLQAGGVMTAEGKILLDLYEFNDMAARLQEAERERDIYRQKVIDAQHSRRVLYEAAEAREAASRKRFEDFATAMASEIKERVAREAALREALMGARPFVALEAGLANSGMGKPGNGAAPKVLIQIDEALT